MHRKLEALSPERQKAIVDGAKEAARIVARYSRDAAVAAEDFVADGETAEAGMEFLDKLTDCEDRFRRQAAPVFQAVAEAISGINEEQVRQTIAESSSPEEFIEKMKDLVDDGIQVEVLNSDSIPVGDPDIPGIDLGNVQVPEPQRDAETDLATGDMVRHRVAGNEPSRGMIIGMADDTAEVRCFGEDAPAEPQSVPLADLEVVPADEEGEA